MASNRFEELVSEIESNSESFAHVSTHLSDQIVAFEKVLQTLKGKVPVSVSTNDGFHLAFKRARSGWKLMAHESELVVSWDYLTGASASTKARAVELFEPLLVKMAEHQKQVFDEVEKASESLGAMLSTICTEVKEGE